MSNEKRKILRRDILIFLLENIFHILRVRLHADAIQRSIRYETFEAFKIRVVDTLREIPLAVIDRTISSIPRRIRDIIKTKGKKTKY